MSEPATEKLLTYKQLKEEHGIPYSRMHLWRLEDEGKFPRRITLNVGSVDPNDPGKEPKSGRIVWKRSEVLAWIENLSAKRKPVMKAVG